MSAKSTLPRGPKGAHMIDVLRRQIMDGELTPGARMPTRSELEQQFQASPVTVQRAFDTLVRDEFVKVKGNRTYVAQHPPHMSRYALLFMANPLSGRDSRGFLATLHQEAVRLDDAESQRLPIYCNTNPFHESASFRQLSADVVSHRVAGLIFSTPAGFYTNTPILQEPGVPRVAIASIQEDPTIPVVGFDAASFYHKSLDYLKSRGRKRVALMYNALVNFSAWQSALQEHGFEVHPHWMLPMSIQEPSTARNCARLLMHAGQNDRPDALIVADDHLVESATAGLLASGVQVPDELDVVAHCNYPGSTEPLLPVVRLGLDVRAMLRTCINHIDAQGRGESVPATTMLPALFAHEVPQT